MATVCSARPRGEPVPQKRNGIDTSYVISACRDCRTRAPQHPEKFTRKCSVAEPLNGRGWFLAVLDNLDDQMLAPRAFKGAPITTRLFRFNGRQPHVRVANFATRTRGRAQNWFVRPHVSPHRHCDLNICTCGCHVKKMSTHIPDVISAGRDCRRRATCGEKLLLAKSHIRQTSLRTGRMVKDRLGGFAGGISRPQFLVKKAYDRWPICFHF